ncbi:MAG: DNA mismatch repair protein MutS, partial [Spirochaetaceae bacterium]
MAETTTPMMIQYKQLKQNHKDAILFFRLGDFYEMFEDDAREASRILDITLTKRANVPMCGIPYHAAGSYIQRLVRAGKKIAVCEQIAMPTPGRGLATREVVQIITPGTLVDEGLLEQAANNYLVAITSLHGRISLSYCDLSTGRFAVTSFPLAEREQRLRCELYRLQPREVVMDESLWETDSVLKRLVDEREDILVNRFPSWYFDPVSAWTRLSRQLNVVTLKGFGLSQDSAEVASAGAVLQYIEDTSKNMLPHIRNLQVYSEQNHVMLDESTQRNLELVHNLQDGSRRYTLYEVLNHTKTAMGARRLYEWILSPLLDKDGITKRLECVNFFFRDQRVLSQVREKLSGILDIERLSSRIAMDRA